MQKPLWFKINKKEIDELTENIYNNEDNNGFKFTINRSKKKKKKKIEAKTLYNKLIQKDIDTPQKSKSNKPEKI